MRPCKDCNKAHEMVLASMEYVKVLGFRIRKTEEISETWKKAAQTHAEECVKLREQLHHLRTAAESGMLPQIVKERDALRAELDTERERHKQTASLLAQYAPTTVDVPRAHPVNREVGAWVSKNCTPCDPPTASHDTPEGKQAAESVIRDDRKTEPDEIKVGDVAKVRSASGNLTAKCNVGQIGEVLKIDSRDGTVLLSGEAGWVDIQDVRKVTT